MCTDAGVSYRVAIGLWLASVAFAQEPTPVFTAARVVSAASFTPGLTPGGLATVFGTGLTFGVNGVLRAPGFPMPANIQGTTLYVNGVAAPLATDAAVALRQKPPEPVFRRPRVPLLHSRYALRADPLYRLLDPKRRD